MRLLNISSIHSCKKATDVTSMLFEFIADRCESKSLLVSPDQLFTEWDEIFASSKSYYSLYR